MAVNGTHENGILEMHINMSKCRTAVRIRFAENINPYLRNAAHKKTCGQIVLVRCIKCHVVDMTLDAPKRSYVECITATLLFWGAC